MASSSMYRARLRDWHETEGSAATGCGYSDKSLDSPAASDLGMKPPPPVLDGHVLLADRCSPDTSHRKLRLPLLLPLLPFLLVAILWVGCLLTATIYALQLLEQLLEVLDPTPPDQFRERNQPVSRTLFAETSTARLTRSGSFCCGWLWARNDTLAPEKPLSLLQRVQRFLRAPRRRLQLLLAESSTATLLEAPWLLLALWRGTPLRRGGRCSPRSPPQLRVTTHDPKRAYYFLLARDELVWHATEAASSRGAMPAGSIRLDSIVEARPPLLLRLRLRLCLPPRPSTPHYTPHLPLPTLAAPCGQVLVEPPLSPLVVEEGWGESEEGLPPLHCFPLLVRTSASRSLSRQGRSRPLGRRWSPTTVLSLLSTELPQALIQGVAQGAAGEGPADVRELRLAAASEVEREGWIAMLHKATKLLHTSEHPTCLPDDAVPAQPHGHALFGALSGFWRSA